MKRLRILTIIAVLLAIITFALKNNKPVTIKAGNGLVVDKTWLITNAKPLTPANDMRPPDQTFLTSPEWFLVFSPAEQADYFKQHTSTTFPYVTHIKQMWGGYSAVNDQIKDTFPYNTGYHVMIMVIAGSTTVEYGIKAVYETVMGRLTDTKTNATMTAEDQFNAAYEQRYVKFIEALPWYQFDFVAELKNLWSNISLTGPHFLRKLERRYYLTTELLVKSGYGWLIGLATQSAYEEASLKTRVVVDKTPAANSMATSLQTLPNGKVLAYLPRYALFAQSASALAAQGINFEEIAGNKGAIMVSVLNDKPLRLANFKVIFTQPLATKPHVNRTVLVTTVSNLSSTLKMLRHDDVLIEHVYDY